MNANASTYRDIGDVDFRVWQAELDRYPSSPLIPIAPALYAICKGHTALALAHMKRESNFETDRQLLTPQDNNPFNLRPNYINGMLETVPGATGIKHDYLTFEDPIFAAREWRRRVVDDPQYKGGVYRPTMTLREYVNTYAPTGDRHPTTGDANETYAADMVTMLTRFAATERELSMAEKITFGKVPHPEYQNHLYVSERKIEGVGWDNLGQRRPKFIALHRMWGSLAGTLSYFKPPTSPHLTDYAIGIKAIDGAAAGIIHKYNDPTGYRSGWASGRVSAPYGDGKAIIDNYGINAVNRDGVSIELSGYWDTPVDDYSWSEYVALIAYWVDFMRIPYSSLPLNPHTGINAFIWHQEFTIGTGKECPGWWLMERTSKLYKDVAAYLKPFQTGTAAGDGTGGGEVPKPVPVPPPVYAKPAPVAVLVAVADKELTAGISDSDGNHYTLVSDLVEAVKDTPRLQSDEPGSPSTGPIIKAKERFPVTYLKVNSRGEEWYVTDYWTFVPVAHTKRISDERVAA